MADNIELPTGSGGETVKTDDDGTAHWQYVKLAYGADNTQSIVTSTGTNPLPVALSDTDNAVLDVIAAGFAAEGQALGSGVLLQGDDGTDRTNVLVDTDGHLQIDVVSSATVTVDCNSSNVTVDGVPAPLNVVGGGTEAAAMRVTIASDSTGLVSVDDNASSLTVDTTGTSGLEVVQVTAADLNMTEASAADIKTAVEKIDDWDESDRAKVNPIAGQAGIAADAGAMSALTTRVTVATDDTHFGTVGAASDIDGVIHGQLRYIADQLVTIDSDTNDIKTAVEALDDAVDGSYLDVNLNAAGTDLAMNAGAMSAQTTRIVIANNDTHFGTVGAASDIDGVIHGQLRYIADQLVTIDADTSNISTCDTTDIRITKIAGEDIQVDEGTAEKSIRVVTASDSPDTVYLSTIDSDTDAIKTAVEIMDDWDDGSNHCEVVGAAAEDAAATGIAPVLAGGRYDSTARGLDTGDVGAIALSVAAETILLTQAKYVQYGDERCEVKHFGTVTSTDDTTIITAVGSKCFLILSLYMVAKAATATDVAFETKTSDTACFWTSTDALPLSADADGDNVAGNILPWNPGGWFKTADTNEDLAVSLTAAQKVGIYGNYIEFTP